MQIHTYFIHRELLKVTINRCEHCKYWCSHVKLLMKGEFFLIHFMLKKMCCACERAEWSKNQFSSTCKYSVTKSLIKHHYNSLWATTKTFLLEMLACVTIQDTYYPKRTIRSFWLCETTDGGDFFLIHFMPQNMCHGCENMWIGRWSENQFSSMFENITNITNIANTGHKNWKRGRTDSAAGLTAPPPSHLHQVHVQTRIHVCMNTNYSEYLLIRLNLLLENSVGY